MARMVLTGGACPVCACDVPRTLQYGAGEPKEIFHCPQDGRLEYRNHSIPLETLGLAAAHMPLRSQPITGVELVA